MWASPSRPAKPEPDLTPLRRVNVAAEHHQGLDRFGDEGGRLVGVGERVRAGPARACALRAGGKDLGLHDARVAVVDRAEHGHRAAVLARVTHEQLTRRVSDARRHRLARASEAADRSQLAHPPTVALCAAWATVSLSTKPSMRTTSVAGRR